MSKALSPFGDGYASERIAEILTRQYAGRLAEEDLHRLNAG
jgi:UDP-N-acetylglucosamine 2-epimerase